MNLKEARTSKQLSQLQLAELTGISIRVIQSYETGARKPKLEQLIRIANALEVPFSDLVEDAELKAEIGKNLSFTHHFTTI